MYSQLLSVLQSLRNKDVYIYNDSQLQQLYYTIYSFNPDNAASLQLPVIGGDFSILLVMGRKTLSHQGVNFSLFEVFSPLTLIYVRLFHSVNF